MIAAIYAYNVFSFLACMALGLLYAWVLYRKSGQLTVWQKGLLSALRAIAVTLISWLLVAPLFKYISYTPEKPLIIIANDNSASVAYLKPDGFNAQQYQSDLAKLAAKLSEKYEVRRYHFGDNTGEGFDFSANGKFTDGSIFLERIKDETANRNLGAVILASDGVFNRGGNPLYAIKQLKAPVYTIALGDTIPKKDLLIADVSYPGLVYLDNEFSLDVQVEAYYTKGTQVQMVVAQDDARANTTTIPVPADRFIKNIPLKLKATKRGIHKITVQLTNLPGETTYENNRQTFFIEVIDAKQKILLAAGSPHPDISAIRQAIEQNPHNAVDVILPDDLNQVKPADYSLIILYQYPDINTPVAAAGWLRKAEELKLPVWYILGAQSSLSAFQQLQDPVKISRSNGALQEVFPLMDNGFSSFIIDAAQAEALKNFDPLLAPFGNMRINGAYTALLRQKIGKIATETPLWFFMDAGQRRSGYLLGEGIWKWKLEEAQQSAEAPLTNELISKTVQYLVAKDDKRKFKVYSTYNTFGEQEPVILNASLYNDAYELVNSPDVKIQVKAESGKLYPFLFGRSGNTYRLDAGTFPAGYYSYTAETQLGDKKFTASGAFYINVQLAEYQQNMANHQLLYTIAQQNGGKMYMPGHLLSLADEISRHEDIKTIRYEERKYEELINFKWLFALIISLLAAEWFLRKRNGEP